ncbi:MAG TPA: hypothetical protein VIF09_15870 [Polyangiaceae bacterium]|jgi:hypothetical protein
MRFIALGFGMAAVLATTVASAAGGTKGDTGGKGGFGPSNSTQSGAAGTAETPSEVDTTQTQYGGRSTNNPDVTNTKKVEEKPWEVGATFESHRLLRQDYNPDGTGPLKVFDLLYLVARYSLTDNDSISMSGGVIQQFNADNTETGFRSTDISLAYSHMFQLPQKFRLRASVGSNIPISYYSQLESNITSPTGSLSLSRKFGDLAVEARWSIRYAWDRYSSAGPIGSGGGDAAGATNLQWGTGGSISAEYDMPFYRPVSAGLALTDSYAFYYKNVGAPPAGTPSYGATTNPVTDGQPMAQSYGGEIFVRYVMPDLGGFKSDLTVALANGDPSLGYPSVLHDGVVHPYLFYYNTAEVYAALSGRY